MSVEWRPIPGHDGYEASSEGQIRSLVGREARILKTWVAGAGYHYTSLGSQFRSSVHTLVAAAFLGPRPDGLVVRHLDCDGLNNRPENLAYGTQSENLMDSVRAGRHAETKKTHCKRGHAFDAENTRPATGRGGRAVRQCRACDQIRSSRRTSTEAVR